MANLEKVIGLPRGLNFYEQYPFLYGFFKHLGIKVVLSDRTTKKTLASGSALVVSETCLPVKIYVGQVLNLLEKGVKNIGSYNDMVEKKNKNVSNEEFHYTLIIQLF